MTSLFLTPCKQATDCDMAIAVTFEQTEETTANTHATIRARNLQCVVKAQNMLAKQATTNSFAHNITLFVIVIAGTIARNSKGLRNIADVCSRCIQTIASCR